ncbi:hypothetical protein [Frateuria defendens]|uniref:hypothetical protein n=1 Tax=Frateuria defendens TaxID=2219559 RepID=UPI00066FE703|nr:hypothetical protein [Frateuria defendens]
MDSSLDFSPEYPRHDLLIEIGRVELAMERLAGRGERERRSMQPQLESRLRHLCEALAHLPR